VKAARKAGIGHFIYLSVAQPALMMEAFIRCARKARRSLQGD